MNSSANLESNFVIAAKSLLLSVSHLDFRPNDSGRMLDFLFPCNIFGKMQHELIKHV